jgi:hypothetical protein
MENNQLVVLVDAKEFGIEESKALQITQAFTSELAELSLLDEQFNEISLKEITPELVELAKELRLKYVKKRTNIAKIHKAEKEFYLVSGKFVDALKNKATTPIEIKEEKLKSVEQYFENIEKESLRLLKIERTELLTQFGVENLDAMQLETMNNEVFNAFYSVCETKYNAKIEAEKQAENARIEKERINKLIASRRLEIAPYLQFYTESTELEKYSDTEFSNLILSLQNAKTDYELEQAKIKAENERLKKQADDLVLKLENERKEAERKAKAIEEENKKKLDEAEALRKKQADEMKAIQDKLEADRKALQEEKRKQELAEIEAKKAPQKEQIEKWIDSIVLTKEPFEHVVIDSIKQKFEGFKKWAVSQKELI